MQYGFERDSPWIHACQICDHLGIFFRKSMEGFSEKMPWLVRVLLSKPLPWIIFRQRGMKSGVKVPASFLPGEG